MTLLTLPVGLVSGCGVLCRPEQVTHRPETPDLNHLYLGLNLTIVLKGES